jgi:hypothetical protein
MLNIQGALQLIPESVSVEPGKLNADGNEISAIVASFNSGQGIIQVILPIDSVDTIVSSILEAKKRSEQQNSDIYIPQGGMNEVEQIAKAKEGLEESVKGQ